MNYGYRVRWLGRLKGETEDTIHVGYGDPASFPFTTYKQAADMVANIYQDVEILTVAIFRADNVPDFQREPTMVPSEAWPFADELRTLDPPF